MPFQPGNAWFKTILSVIDSFIGSFGVLNGNSVVSLEQVCQRGREIACECRGPLYEAWCAIKEVMENDWLYEDQPFAPAKSIAKTVIFEEYLSFRE